MDEPTDITLETLNQKVDLVLERLDKLLEPKSHFDSKEYARANGIRWPGGG